MKPPISVRTVERSRIREQPLRSRYNRLTKDHHVGALKDLLVDPKDLLADRVDHLGGLADLLAGLKDRLVDRAAHLVDPKVLPVDQAGRPEGLADLLVDPEAHPAKFGNDILDSEDPHLFIE